MNPSALGVTREDRVLTLTLNRPEKRNALNGTLVEALAGALEDGASDDRVSVILLRGEGPDFCAGADLAELEVVTSQGPEASLADAQRLGALLLQMRAHPRPIVAAVQGRALAGGCGLATACDLVLAQEDAEFGYPEVHLGFVPAMVMAILRQKLGEGRAFEMVAMGQRIPAQEAHRIGLVNRVFDRESFSGAVIDFVKELGRRPPEALRLTKSLLYELADLSMEAGIRRGAEVNVQARETQECKEGVEAFLARRRGESN